MSNVLQGLDGSARYMLREARPYNHHILCSPAEPSDHDGNILSALLEIFGFDNSRTLNSQFFENPACFFGLSYNHILTPARPRDDQLYYLLNLCRLLSYFTYIVFIVFNVDSTLLEIRNR